MTYALNTIFPDDSTLALGDSMLVPQSDTTTRDVTLVHALKSGRSFTNSIVYGEPPSISSTSRPGIMLVDNIRRDCWHLQIVEYSDCLGIETSISESSLDNFFTG
jgi:hypothetical protein